MKEFYPYVYPYFENMHYTAHNVLGLKEKSINVTENGLSTDFLSYSEK